MCKDITSLLPSAAGNKHAHKQLTYALLAHEELLNSYYIFYFIVIFNFSENTSVVYYFIPHHHLCLGVSRLQEDTGGSRCGCCRLSPQKLWILQQQVTDSANTTRENLY